MRILLPIDGSDAANQAVEFVRLMAKANPIDVTVIVANYDPAHFTLQPWVPEWTELENQRTQTILSQAKLVLDSVCKSVCIVQGSGAVVPCILDQAKKSKAELIVVGAKGHSAIARVMLGSISDSLATRAECSVLVVRPNADKTPRLSKILLAYDKSVASREAAAELMEWKLNREVQVDVVSVVENPYVYLGEGYMAEPITVTPHQIAVVSETAERMASQIAEHFPHTRSHAPVANHVGEAIVKASENTHADLVVVGDTGHSMLGALLLGSTSRYVLHQAQCSVLISRHHWKASATAKEIVDATAAT